MLEDFLVSKTRVKVLHLFFTNLSERYHVREITRQVGEEINAVRRELSRLSKLGVLKKERKGNRLYYFLDHESFLFPELLGLVSKDTGMGKLFIKEAKNLGKLKFVMFSSLLFYGRVAGKNEVDVLVVGNVPQGKISAIIKEGEKYFGHEINYTILSEEELGFRKSRQDPFINSLLLQPKIMIWGSEKELLA